MSADFPSVPCAGPFPAKETVSVNHDRGSKRGIFPVKRESRPLCPSLPTSPPGRSRDRGSSTALFAVDDPQSCQRPAARSDNSKKRFAQALRRHGFPSAGGQRVLSAGGQRVLSEGGQRHAAAACAEVA